MLNKRWYTHMQIVVHATTSSVVFLFGSLSSCKLLTIKVYSAACHIIIYQLINYYELAAEFRRRQKWVQLISTATPKIKQCTVMYGGWDQIKVKREIENGFEEKIKEEISIY